MLSDQLTAEAHARLAPELDDIVRIATARYTRQRDGLRAAYIAGAEEEWCRRHGRPLSPEQLELVLRHYPGD